MRRLLLLSTSIAVEVIFAQPITFIENFNNAPDYSNNWTIAWQTTGSPTTTVTYTPGNFRIQAPNACPGGWSPSNGGVSIGFHSIQAFTGDLDVSFQFNHSGFGRTSVGLWSKNQNQQVINATLDTDDTNYLAFGSGSYSTDWKYSGTPYMNQWITLRIQIIGTQVNFYADNGTGPQLLQTYPIPVTSPPDSYYLFFGTGSVCWKSGPNDTSFRLVQATGTLSAPNACALTVPLMQQTDSRWSGDVYDDATAWPNGGGKSSTVCPQGHKVCIASWGCNLTAATMLINYQASQQRSIFATDPETLNTWLESNSHTYPMDGLVRGCDVSEYAKRNGVTLFYRHQACVGACSSQDDAIVSSYLCSNNPVVLQVPSPAGGHFVLATGQTTVSGTPTFSINDPYPFSPPRSTLASYGKYFSIDEYSSTQIGSTPACNGWAKTMTITAHSPVELVITDPSGNRTGYDPIADTSYTQIPGSSYYPGSITEDIVPASGATSPLVQSLEIPTAVTGRYLLRVTGTGYGTYTIDVQSYDVAANRTVQSITGNASQGVANQFAVDYTSTSGGSTILSGPFSLCDTNQDGIANIMDVQKVINEVIGGAVSTDDVNGDGVVNVVDVQITINAALGLGCSAT